MNLLYISGSRIPSEKADVINQIKMCNSFVKHGLRVKLLYPFRIQTPKMKGVKDIWSFYGVEKNFEIIKLPSLDLVFLDRIFPKLGWLFSSIQNFSYAICAFFFVFFQRLSADTILYSSDIFTTFLLLLFKGFVKHRMIYEAHRPARIFPIYLMRRLDVLVVLNQGLKEWYIRKGMPSEKVLVAQNGVDLEKFDIGVDKQEARKSLNILTDKKIIGYVGRLQGFGADKGITELIEAVGMIRQGGKDVLMYFVGSTRETAQKYINNAIGLNGEEDCLVFVGFIPHKDVPIYLKSFDVVVAPFSRTEYYSCYASAHKIFEYMSSKRPIVATDLPATREILGENGENAIFVEPGNPRALAEGIGRVLEDEELARRISTQAFEDIKNFTWDKRAVRVLEYINSGKDKMMTKTTV